MLRITIREWMLAVVIAAVGTAWCIDRAQWQQRLLESGKVLYETREALVAVESAHEDAVRANGMIVDFLESRSYIVRLPEEVYVSRRSKNKPPLMKK